MTKHLVSSMFALLFLFAHISVSAGSGNGAWTSIENSRIAFKGQRIIEATQYQSYHLNLNDWSALLALAPEESNTNKAAELILSLPMSDGTFQDFSITTSGVMHPDLAARYPDIQPYNAQGITDRTAIAQLDVTPFGFHAMIL